MEQDELKIRSLSEFQPISHDEENTPKWKKIMYKLDIFAFLPVPRSQPVSTKASIWGSLLLLTIFLCYILFSFISFLLLNVPRVNQYTDAIDTDKYNTPQLAIAFFFGDTFNETINDPTLFTITMQQVTKYQSVGKEDLKIEVPLMNCNPDWIPSTDGYPMLCPKIDTNMSGLLYATKEYIYPRFTVNYCNPSKLDCATQEDLFKKTSGGRVLMYMKTQGANKNFATGNTQNNIEYQTFQFFLAPGFYLRSEIILQKQTFTEKPDYFTSYLDDVSQYLVSKNINYFVSNVTIYNAANAYQIWLRLDQDQLHIEIVYQTIVDMISKWGAFWGVLFAIFALIFLRFNMNRFYQKNPDWYKFYFNEFRADFKKHNNGINDSNKEYSYNKIGEEAN